MLELVNNVNWTTTERGEVNFVLFSIESTFFILLTHKISLHLLQHPPTQRFIEQISSQTTPRMLNS